MKVQMQNREGKECVKSIFRPFIILTFALAMMPMLAEARPEAKDSTAVLKKEKKSFWKAVSSPIRWIGKNWSAYDPRYSTPSFYNWVGQLQNNFSEEWLNMKSNDGMQVNMHSRLSSKFGPYLGYSFLGYGYSINLGAIHGSKGRSEMGLDINSNLMNIQLIWRHTGGDFQISKFSTRIVDDSQQLIKRDVTEMAKSYDLGGRIKYSVVGANFNLFLNHKKYSNPAAFSNGAIQLRSAGSPIVGFGIQRQKITTTISDLLEGYVFQNMVSDLKAYDPTSIATIIYQFNQQNGTNFSTDETGVKGIFDYIDKLNYSDDDADDQRYKTAIGSIIKNPSVSSILFGTSKYVNVLINQIPSTMTIDDYHLQLGYAYNLVFSKRLLLGLSIIASPGIKHVRMDNEYNLTNFCADEFVDAANSYYSDKSGIPLDQLPADKKATRQTFCMDLNRTQFGYDFFGRASITYNFNRWRVGVNASASAYIYKSDDASMRNIYGNANVYVGYCFGRKKQYRWNGKDRQTYIMAALTKKDIEAMRDTMPAGNISNGKALAETKKKTKYHTNTLDLDVNGCDLVKGPDGTYGSYVIEDGYVTPGQDSEGHLKPGTVIPIDKNGDLKISCGYDKDFRTANWLKSQVDVRQIPTNWYPEMLHYALKGKLTLWVRSYKLGTTEPVKLVIDDFYVDHGKETEEFAQIASKNFYSHSAYSIIGNIGVNGRKVRVYIESKHNGKNNYINVCPMKASALRWMANVPDERPISRMSIPATHDAGTASLPEGKMTSMAHTQNLTIAEQLEDGIRAFDIRLKHNMKFGHTMECRDGLPETLDSIQKFLKANPSEFVVAMIGSDEGGKWSDDMKTNYSNLISQYSTMMVDSFSARTPLRDVRGKILVIKRQEDCPFGKLLKFEDNAIFEDNGFCVEDVYKEHKTYKKIKIVEQHIREAHECLDQDKWYITFNSIAWDPRHHKPYYSAWGAMNIRKPMNPSLRGVIEDKSYTNFGMVFLDFYNDHCDHPQLVESIIKSNFNTELEKDYIPMGK